MTSPANTSHQQQQQQVPHLEQYGRRHPQMLMIVKNGDFCSKTALFCIP
jgi:hypothetical protein